MCTPSVVLQCVVEQSRLFVCGLRTLYGLVALACPRRMLAPLVPMLGMYSIHGLCVLPSFNF